MTQWWIGKGYGVSDIKDVSGRPLLTYQGLNDKQPVVLYDRVAQTFDFTVARQLTAGAMKNERLNSSVSAAIKKVLGGKSDDELDHKISLELGGSNTPANLFVQPGRTSGASAASDELENGLAADVVTGKISLEQAWEILSEQKGFLLSEDMVMEKTLDTNVFTEIVKLIYKTQIIGIGSMMNPLSILGIPLINLSRTPATTTKVAKIDATLKSTLDTDMLALSKDSMNQKLLTKVFKGQVQLTAQQLLISDAEAGRVVKSYLAGYADSKGIDAKGMMGALNMDIQKIVSASKSDPNIFGISSVTITKIVAVLQTISVGAVYVGIILAVIGIFIAGPSAVVGALSGGLLESIGAIFGVSALTGIGLTTFAVGEAFNVAAIGLNMSVKSLYDNKYLLPTQQINALKEALAIQKGLAAFLPSEVTSLDTTTTSKSSTGSGSATSMPTTKVFTGIVSQGVVTPGLTFEARPNNMISTVDDLKHAATNNLAPFLQALPGKVIYEIKIVSSVTTKDGFVQRGTTQRIQTGTTKAGVPTYKTITNKFATLILYIMTDKGNKTKISTIVLGPVDSAKLQPAQSDLTALQTDLPALVTTTDIADITAIVSAQPITVTPPATVSPTPTVTPATTQTQTQTQTYNQPTTVTPPATTTPAIAPITTQTVNKPTTTTVNPGANATTLYDWYTANGQALPSISARASAYQLLGLGQASYYTGTAEQNTILLNKLKSQ